MKKTVLLGALFGLLIVPVSVLGLVNQTVERIAPPFTWVPRIIVNSVMDTASTNGAVTMGSLLILSVLFYALVGYATGKLHRAYGKWMALMALVALYVALVVLNVNVRL